MDDAIREMVRRRAKDRCEYCLLPQEASFLTFHVDHIIARQHLDVVVDELEHLCLACNRCNAFKGTNLSSIGPQTAQHVPLFHPRNDRWSEHFEMDGGMILGLTAVGRATIRLLQMNAPQRVELRQQWLANGREF
ncbi:HNH endonuclease [Rubinisphaera margarita]|uniref:HNH endonuclease n=1 Tax=Rubinisphaera margarita TaxID=2909586 RepID=UPI001EE7D46C|nr:HNH endonuclease signature motif containing protein [Rubinisphaera margarita]MCG6155738.1 HNH endonuclease [Rubinisphaera margarita]